MDRRAVSCMSPSLGVRVGFAATRKDATSRHGDASGVDRITEPQIVDGTQGLTVIDDNRIVGTLGCSGNDPEATNNGHPTTSSGARRAVHRHVTTCEPAPAHPSRA